MSLDQYVTLGRSGLRVSPFALGAMTFGEDPGSVGCSVEESEKILSTYLDLGGNFIDTANFYTNGHSEKILGDYFAAHPGQREHVVLASKFFFNMFPGDPNGGGAGRSSIIAQLDETLRRMQIDHLDLYWLHNWDRNTPIEETMRTLDDLVRAGKIRYIGFSNTPAWVTAQAHTMALLKSWTPLVALQVEYSLLARTVEGELAPLALDQGMALVPWGHSRMVSCLASTAGTPRSRTRPARPSSAPPTRTSSRSSTPWPPSPTNSTPAWQRYRWLGCAPGKAPSCPSSAPGASNTCRATSPAST
ncbi:MAG: aldo/keto reductase [Amycolatopsis sp.]|nr:aldo/keto reductase [Amycolatopsis sp.]